MDSEVKAIKDNVEDFKRYWDGRLKKVKENYHKASKTQKETIDKYHSLHKQVVSGLINFQRHNLTDFTKTIPLTSQEKTSIVNEIEGIINSISAIKPKIIQIPKPPPNNYFENSCDTICKGLKKAITGNFAPAVIFLGMWQGCMKTSTAQHARDQSHGDVSYVQGKSAGQNRSKQLNSPSFDVERRKLDQYCQQKDDKIHSLQSQLDMLSKRLSTEMSNKLSSDESNVENVSIKNRPMKVSDDYSHFCSQAWLEAKKTLDVYSKINNHEEFLSFYFLADILKVAEHNAKQAHQITVSRAVTILNQPTTDTKHAIFEAEKSPHDLPLGVSNAIGDYLRISADKTDMVLLEEEVINAIKSSNKYHQLNNTFNKGFMQKYIKQAVQLTWIMALQRPPMTFGWDVIDGEWNEKTQEPYWNCDPHKPNVKVRFYVYPVLYHGTSVMVKGKVYIG